MKFAKDHIIWVIFNKPNVKTYTYVLNFINIIIVDFGIFNLYTAQKKYQKESRHVFCLFMLIILFGITPWLCIPYSDCYSFTICTLLLRLFLKYNAKSKFSFFDAITLGIAAFIGYLMKPSLMIMILAFLNVTIVFSKCKKNIIISILIFIIGLFSWNLIKKNNSLVSINPSESFSMYHFIAMGNHGTGAYNDNDVRTDQAIKSYEKRKKHDIKNIENIYSVNGISGMQNFYIRKQVSDTSDGTFAWGGEGNFLRPFRLNNNVLLKLFGKRDHNNFVIGYSSLFEIFEQVAWEFVLLMLFFCLPFDDYISQLLKYIVVGIFMFLLIFEGGRSRYLIQVLPAIIMLSESGFEMIKSHINNMI